MTRIKLAEQLRGKIRQRGKIPLETLSALDDDFIVDSYLNTACEDCGKKLAEGLDVEHVLAESRSLDDFFARCVNAKCQAYTFALVHWWEEIDAEGEGGGAK